MLKLKFMLDGKATSLEQGLGGFKSLNFHYFKNWKTNWFYMSPRHKTRGSHVIRDNISASQATPAPWPWLLEELPPTVRETETRDQRIRNQAPQSPR